MRTFIALVFLYASVFAQEENLRPGLVKTWFRDSSTVLVPVPAGKRLGGNFVGTFGGTITSPYTTAIKFWNTSNVYWGDTVKTAYGIPSGTSGQWGWFTYNAVSPQSGTIATATATDTIKAGIFQGSGALITSLPISGTTALQDSLTVKLNRTESFAAVQDSLNVKLNRTEVIASIQDSLNVKANRSEAFALVQDSLTVKLNRSEAGTMAKADSVTYHGGASINTLGKIATYNAVTTDGFGAVIVIDTVLRTAQTTDISAVNFSNVSAGLYEVSAYVQCTTLSGAGAPTLAVTIAWTDAVGATSRDLITGFSLSATGRTYSTPNLIQLASGNITWATTVSAPAGTPQYSLHIVLKRIA